MNKAETFSLTAKQLFVEEFIEQCMSAMDICAMTNLRINGYEDEEKDMLRFIIRAQALRVWKRNEETGDANPFKER